MTPSTRSLKVFVRVVEDRSFAAAARNLFIDPAAVSRTIKTLEDELGTLLFTRSTRVSKLTAEGERFYRDCRPILQKLDEATDRFRHQEGVLRGQLRVGLAPMITRRMVVRALPSFQRQHPQLEIVLLSVDDPGEIANGSVDVLVRPRTLRRRGGSHRALQGLVIRKLIQSHLVVCASPEYLARVGVPLTPPDLLGHECIALVTLEHDVQNEWQFAKSSARHKVKFVPKLLVQGDALRETGLAGCGIIRLLACHVQEEFRSGSLVQVLTDWDCIGGPPIVALYRKAKPTLPRVSAFVRYLVEAFRPYNVATSQLT
jgi:LysR family transcriptional regulator, regulator for bpeEF and oprC